MCSNICSIFPLKVDRRLQESAKLPLVFIWELFTESAMGSVMWLVTGSVLGLVLGAIMCLVTGSLSFSHYSDEMSQGSYVVLNCSVLWNFGSESGSEVGSVMVSWSTSVSKFTLCVKVSKLTLTALTTTTTVGIEIQGHRNWCMHIKGWRCKYNKNNLQWAIPTVVWGISFGNYFDYFLFDGGI